MTASSPSFKSPRAHAPTTTTPSTRIISSAQPYRTLVTAFLIWKAVLFAIALGSTLVGDAYDTSADLLVHGGVEAATTGQQRAQQPLGLSGGLVSRFASWDAIYFLSSAKRGYIYEQEWAFGAGLPIVVRGILQGARHVGIAPPAEGGVLPEAVIGVTVANTAHFLSVIVLFRLGQVVWRDRTLSLVAALLHIVSPAGMFLTAPYMESSYAFLAFTGYLLFALSSQAESRALTRDVYLVLAGIFFGLATAFRSNGILNGIPFAWEVLRHLPNLPHKPFDTIRRLVALGIGGICVALGSIIPQAIAYGQFCSGASGVDPRPWCEAYLPSIFTFVQEHYWNVGFLRYWTISNLPLFLLATPMLAILVRSGVEQPTSARQPVIAAKPVESAQLTSLIQSAAAAQVVLAVLAIAMYHVQIITRISSGYPLWYWWVAGSLIRGEKVGGYIVKFMVLYALIQGVLFTSFLPPA
ncbi:ER membrane glycoprotein subunit of the GPI transamidase complex-like protein [Podospora pseudopauciseta]|uniref:GPI mannosyltransferase 2 n=2 Tax=Podospora TaxID=5144 RepID=A0ABR0HDP7_9PEZI|nr:ER membrane glycoprotein subunit of the GPI transamidase complex-like protein [Podospora pseudopauciseta]KAK4677174.1 ER membrane glycoprotein subunit of the GPI transamidase complex-like protein [Podospora pseudoanserina]